MAIKPINIFIILLLYSSQLCASDNDSTTVAPTTASTTVDPLVTNVAMRRKLLNQRILAVMGIGVNFENTKLESTCKDIYSHECKTTDLQKRVKDFFTERNKSYCYDDILFKKPCTEHSAAVNNNWIPKGISKEEVDKIFDTRLKQFFSNTHRVTCLAANVLEPSQFVQLKTVAFQETSGPAKQNIRSLHCVNIVWSHTIDETSEVLHIMNSAVPVATKNCLSKINFRQCYYNKQKEGTIEVPSYTHEGKKWILGAYTLTVGVDKHADGPCELKTTCITEGSEVKPGVHSIRGFETTVIVHGKRGTGRRLMASENTERRCSSGTYLGEGGSAQVVGDNNDGPGERITFCNGTLISRVKLGEEQGCFSVRRVKAFRNCKPPSKMSACRVEEELRDCGHQRCMSVHQDNKGLVKVTRSGVVEVHTCDKDCLIPIPRGKGDIQIDCPGGSQHFLESNVVDIDCPSPQRLNGFMLYFCRMSHRPRTCLTLFIWLAAGYGIVCLGGYLFYYFLLTISKVAKSIKRRYTLKGDFCIKCEQKCKTSLEQTLHDENCSFNICPFCGNRLPEEGLKRHVPGCSKRKERLEEIELYLDYQLVPCLLYFAIKMALKFGTGLKRLSWFIILLALLLTTIAPVKGEAELKQKTDEASSDRVDALALWCTLEGLLATLFLLQVVHVAMKSRKTAKKDKVPIYSSLHPVETATSTNNKVPKTRAQKSARRGEPKRQPKKEPALTEGTEEPLLNRAEELTLGDWNPRPRNQEAKYSRSLKSITRSIPKLSLTVALLALIICSLLTSAVGFDSGPLPDGIWEEEQKLVSSCGQECFITEDECTCPHGQPALRKLLFFKGLNPASSNILSSHKLLTSISIDAPWGAIKVESTYKPKLTASNIQLAWNSVEEQGDKVILSGKSTSIVKLEEKTGLQWVLGSESAAEEKRLLVSVLDYTQIYSSTFQYLTGDRLVSEWPKATCTGGCPNRCGCSTTSCLFKTWPHSRNWRCNPSWCWGIGTGCTCCGVDIERPFNKYIAVKWTTEYVRTDVLVCVELTDLERHCDIVEAGSQFVIGPVRVVVSDPQNVQTKLPQEVLTIQKLQDSQHLDLMHVTSIISAKNACKLQSCTHGSPGDMQILHTDNLIQHSHDDGINLASTRPSVNSTWMSWEGCDLDYFCTTGSWPSCTFTGINTINTESFENLLNTEANLCDRFHFHSKRIHSTGSTLQIDLKGRPKTGGGELSVLVDVKGLELHSKKTVLKGLSFKTLTCSGCYACSSGVSCAVEVKIERPDEFTVHLRSTDPNTAVSEGSIMARKMSGGPVSKIRAFAVTKSKEICLEIVEKSYCPGCREEDTKKCVGIDLTPPKDILLEHKGTIIKGQNDTCDSGLQCWSESTAGFGRGIRSFFKTYLGSFALGLTLTIVPLILLLVFFCLGDKLFVLCKCFRCCRQLARRRQKVDDSEDEMRALLKKFNKGGELFGKLGKDARTIAMVLSGRGKDYKGQV
ncbi:glycoprotein precursor [Meihua Mountain virus]|uniref:M polyprotein n=1 Tax=Meihua Mountain virus TaxID=2943855 RepID=A0AAE9HR62_9VIRU|nr:glycoprotein precursor [Meihua Mountain virus]